MDKNLRLSLDLLRGFRAAARHLSFTRAARELFVTQSAISREIKKLEEQIGQPLFHRVNRALQLTHAGEELYRAADEALALIDAATERLAGAGRTLGVTTTTALASLWLVPRLPQFTRRHPGIDVRIAATNDMFNLEREHLDIAIRYVPPGWDIPSGVRLVDYEIFPVCSPAYARDKSRPLRTPADLAGHVLLDFEAILYGRSWYDWEQWFDAMKIRKGDAGRHAALFALRPGHPCGAGRQWRRDREEAASRRAISATESCSPRSAANGWRDSAASTSSSPSLARRDTVDAFVAWLRNEVQPR